MEAKILLPIVIASVIIFSISLSYFVFSFQKNKLIEELSKLKPTKDTLDLIKVEDCKKLEKYENEWVVSECKEDITIHLVLRSNGGYVMRVCGGWNDGREVATKARMALEVLGIKLDCDLNSIKFLRSEDGISVYEICGKSLYMKGGCIV